MATVIEYAQLADAAGTELGASSWVALDQPRIDAFAEVTGDKQWIHTDPQRAADGPFGGTIAHGWLVLSLLPGLVSELLEVPGRRLSVNYGVDRVRFTAPVPVGSRVRLRARIAEVTPRGDALLVKLAITIELEGQEQPAAVGEVLSLAVGAA